MKYEYVHCERNLRVFAKEVLRRTQERKEEVIQRWRISITSSCNIFTLYKILLG
jgi:hypothetical protein